VASDRVTSGEIEDDGTNWTISTVREAIAAKKASARGLPRSTTRGSRRAIREINAVPDTVRETRLRASGIAWTRWCGGQSPLPLWRACRSPFKDNDQHARRCRHHLQSKILDNYIPPYDAQP